jgi:hypothetical protein
MIYGKLEQCIQQLNEQEELLRQTKMHLEQELTVVARSLVGDQARRDLFNYMYWHCLSLSTSEIAIAFGLKFRISLVDPLHKPAVCTVCRAPTEQLIQSRTALREDPLTMCVSCQQALKQREKEKQEEQNKYYKAKFAQQDEMRKHLWTTIYEGGDLNDDERDVFQFLLQSDFREHDRLTISVIPDTYVIDRYTQGHKEMEMLFHYCFEALLSKKYFLTRETIVNDEIYEYLQINRKKLLVPVDQLSFLLNYH